MLKLLAAAIAGISLAVLPSAAVQAQTLPQDEIIAAAEAAVEAGAPGAIVLVRSGGESLAVARGLADRAEGVPMSADYLIRMASITKLYTAAVIVRLAQLELVDLDAPVRQYLPAEVLHRIANADRATVRQLLNHTSGIPDYYDWRSTLFWDWREPLTPERIFAHVRGKAATGPAGAEYEYSNTNYHLLALIAEAASGESLDALYRIHLFEPAGLEHTLYNGLFAERDLIHGYGSEFRRWRDTYDWQENTGPDGGMAAPAQEIALFLEALFAPGGALEAIGRDMLADPVEYEERKAYGLGVDILTTRSGDRLYGHTGSVWGYLSGAFYLPDRDTTMIVHINRNDEAIFGNLVRNTGRAIMVPGGE